METSTLLYFISIFDSLRTLFLLIGSISLIMSITGMIIYLFDQDINDKILMKIFIPIFAISSLIVVFTPSTNQSYVIFGIGGTIDYLKENDVAKRLPDKTFKCIDKFMNDYIEPDSLNDK